MKRVLSFILALTMTLTLCACGSGSRKLSPYLMDFQFGAGEDATEKTILDLEKNDTSMYRRIKSRVSFGEFFLLVFRTSTLNPGFSFFA